MLEKYYFITKLTLGQNKLIESAYAYEVQNGIIKGFKGKVDRDWFLKNHSSYQIKHCHKNNQGKWVITGNFSFDGHLFSWKKKLPLNLPKHKAFYSFYHFEDQEYREKAEKQFNDILINKSVKDGDIDTDNCTDYIRHLIRENHLDDTSLLVVLVGPKTKGRKYIDWEIYWALDYKIGDRYSGVLGLLLPSHPDFGTGTFNPENVPSRLAANVDTGYAVISDWTEDCIKMQNLVETTLKARKNVHLIKNKTIPQMQRNTCS